MASLFDLTKYITLKRDSFKTKEECLLSRKKYAQSNPRFSLFTHSLFTAGDKIDFEKYAWLSLVCEPVDYTNDTDLLKNLEKYTHEPYKDINVLSVINTYEYLNAVIKKGILIMIRKNQLYLYLPFSNANYKNPFVEKAFVSQREKFLLEENDYHLIKKQLVQNLQKFIKDNKSRPMLHDRLKWTANNCWYSADYPEFEGDLHYGTFKLFFEELLSSRKVPDCTFYINPKDFPLYNKDGSYPYDHIFEPNEKLPIVVEPNVPMCPIFSQSVREESGDLLMPTSDDVLRITQAFVVDKCENGYLESMESSYEKEWDKKVAVAFFRGGATGCGITDETNPRLMLAKIAKDNKSLINGGITDYNAKVKRYKGSPLQVINKQNAVPLIAKADNIEKSKHKYIINIEGSTSAFRLSHEMSFNSVILIVKSKYRMWFSHLLKNNFHYIEIAEDLSDLIEKINWCKANDDKCKKIAENAVEFFNTYLTKDKIFDYFTEQLCKVAANTMSGPLSLCLPPPANKKVAIITCYRNTPDNSRRDQGIQFLKISTSLYKNISETVDIYIITQADTIKFNIGKLKNIGFEKASSTKDYDNYIFTDIDMIPNLELFPYMSYTPKTIMCMAFVGTRWTSSLKNKEPTAEKWQIDLPFLGGMININKEIFTKINGYPNNFFGWGGEDECIISRFVKNNVTDFEVPAYGRVIDLEPHITPKNKTDILRENDLVDNLKLEKVYYDLKSFSKNGLNSLHYKVVEEIKLGDNITEYMVDLTPKPEDEFMNPPKIDMEYKAAKEMIRKERYKLFSQIYHRHIFLKV